MIAIAPAQRIGLPGPSLRDWLGPLRLRFVLITPICTGLGIAVVRWQQGSVDAWAAALATVGAVLAHVSVNALNEYCDFRSGLDSLTRRTAFSGGSGTLQQYPVLARYVLAVGVIGMLLTCLIGVYFLHHSGIALLPLGLAGVLLVGAYSQWIVNRPWLSLVAPGLGIGPAMVMGTAFVVSGHYSASAAAASLVVFFLGNNLLLLNQFPDMEPDRQVGRKNLPIMRGRAFSARVFAAFALLAYLVLMAAVSTGLLPRWCLLGLLAAPLSAASAIGATRHADDLSLLLPAMTLNVAADLATPLMMAVGLLLS